MELEELGRRLELDELSMLELVTFNELLEREELKGLDELLAELTLVHTNPPIFTGWLVQVLLLIQLWEFSQPHPLCVLTQLG